MGGTAERRFVFGAASTQFRAMCRVPQGSGPSCQCGEKQPKLTQMDKQLPHIQKLQKKSPVPVCRNVLEPFRKTVVTFSAVRVNGDQ